MSSMFANTTPEQASADFWDWMGPRMDAWAIERAEQIESMPERDEESRTILGAEALDIEFEPVSQAPLRTCVRCGNKVHSDDPTPTHKCLDVMAELAIW